MKTKQISKHTFLTCDNTDTNRGREEYIYFSVRVQVGLWMNMNFQMQNLEFNETVIPSCYVIKCMIATLKVM